MTEKTEAVMLWEGRRVDEMTREELLGVIEALAGMIERDRTESARALGVWLAARRARRSI